MQKEWTSPGLDVDGSSLLVCSLNPIFFLCEKWHNRNNFIMFLTFLMGIESIQSCQIRAQPVLYLFKLVFGLDLLSNWTVTGTGFFKLDWLLSSLFDASSIYSMLAKQVIFGMLYPYNSDYRKIQTLFLIETHSNDAFISSK